MFELGTSAQFNRVSMGRSLSRRYFSLQELPLSSFGGAFCVTARFLQSGNHFSTKDQFFSSCFYFVLKKGNKLESSLGCLGSVSLSILQNLSLRGHKPTHHGPHHLLGLHRGAHQLWGFGLKSAGYKKSPNTRKPERRKACPGSLKI